MNKKKVQKPRIVLFAGGIEQYWTECGMDDLPAAMERDIQSIRLTFSPAFLSFPLFV